MVSPSAAAFTVSSHEVLDLDKATKSDADPSAKSANGDVCLFYFSLYLHIPLCVFVVWHRAKKSKGKK
jgi:hypothetical protein